ncbi:hypothetical protein B0H10DRAFT_2052513 [Mycena sp. CBHHK59/15]|nr:hypothetical protein B0H10DRAFT_2052513 [Mycena sp. CBHHK59/15]
MYLFSTQQMSSTGSTKAPRKRAPKPRTEPLRRGKACLNCRHLKIRCDGARPVCGPCTRVPKDDDCEFTDGHSRTKELQRTINRLQARVEELENPDRILPSIVLTNPNSLSEDPGSHSSVLDFYNSSPSSPASSIISGRSSPDIESDHSLIGVQEPPITMIQMLFDQFLPHASQFGFFMHVGRFRSSTLLRLPFGHAARPSPALLCAVYLWGVHLSRSQPLISYEAVFIRRAQQHISTELSDSAHPSHRIHTIQAHAEFHMNGAVTLSLGYHLHKIHSSRPSSPPLLSVPGLIEVFPNPPRDEVEEGERINAFWAVFCLQTNLIVAVRPANSLGMLESPGLEIDTPWPLDMADYELGLLPPDFLGSATIQNFLNDGGPGTSSIFALQAQASVLLQRATQLARKWNPSMQPQAFSAHMSASAWLDARIQQFRLSVPPLSDYYSRGQEARTLAVVHSLLAAAVIQLYHTAAGAGPTCITAARAIIEALGDTNVPDFMAAAPVVGALLRMACQVLIAEVEKARYFRTTLGSTLNVDVALDEEPRLLIDLQCGLTTMTIYAMDSPFVQYQLSKVQQKCDALFF